MSTKSWHLPRRSFLRAAGVSLALPYLHGMSAGASEQSVAAPKRFAFIGLPNGKSMDEWKPKSAGFDYELSYSLQPMKALKDKVSVLSGLAHPSCGGNHYDNDELLTARKSSRFSPGAQTEFHLSLDQLIARRVGLDTRYPSLEVGHAGRPFSFTESAPNPPDDDLRSIFNRLFGADKGSPQERRMAFWSRRSILDAVMEQSGDLKRKMGTLDKRKLDEYLTSVREVERRVQKAEEWSKIPKAKTDPGAVKLGSDRSSAPEDYALAMVDLMFLALKTDTTRVVSYSKEATDYSKFLPIKDGDHHHLSHHNNDEAMLAELKQIDRFNVGLFARLMSKLDSVEEADGTMLDNTLLLYGCGASQGGHRSWDLPILCGGNMDGKLKQGQHVDYLGGKEKTVPLSNLYLTMLQAMDIEEPSFVDSTGTLSELI